MEVLAKTFEELFNIHEPIMITINVNEPTVNIDHSTTNNNNNSTTNNITNNPEPKVELRQCTKCKWNKPIDQYYSTRITGLTQQCKTCREGKSKSIQKKRDNIKRNMINTETEKTCVECGMKKPKDKFISLTDEKETKLCLECRNNFIKYSRCEHDTKRNECQICNPIGYNIHFYRKEMKCLINKRYSENYVNNQLGCDRKTFIAHIESQFTDYMNWDNYTKYWEYDHILPLMEIVDGKYISQDEIKRRMHYKNIRPLPIAENQAKGNRNLSLSDE